jgi:hypothetical protein
MAFSRLEKEIYVGVGVNLQERDYCCVMERILIVYHCSTLSSRKNLLTSILQN